DSDENEGQTMNEDELAPYFTKYISNELLTKIKSNCVDNDSNRHKVLVSASIAKSRSGLYSLSQCFWQPDEKYDKYWIFKDQIKNFHVTCFVAIFYYE
ncbi:MAG: hypothetical protein MHPSP_002308, partial [Paramarteilia canceri]